MQNPINHFYGSPRALLLDACFGLKLLKIIFALLLFENFNVIEVMLNNCVDHFPFVGTIYDISVKIEQRKSSDNWI